MKKAPAAVKNATEGNGLINLPILGYVPTKPALAGGVINKHEMINWNVQAHCAMKPSRPPTPNSHFWLSNNAIIDVHVAPRTTAPDAGMTAILAMPTNDPQVAASANFSESIIAESNAVILDARIGPKL